MDAPPPETLPPSGASSVVETAATFVVFTTCVVAPVVVFLHVGAGWGAATGILLALGWLTRMPTTCWGGGLIWSLLGMQMVIQLLGWSVFGAVLLVSAVF